MLNIFKKYFAAGKVKLFRPCAQNECTQIWLKYNRARSRTISIWLQPIESKMHLSIPLGKMQNNLFQLEFSSIFSSKFSSFFFFGLCFLCHAAHTGLSLWLPFTTSWQLALVYIPPTIKSDRNHITFKKILLSSRNSLVK